MVKLCLQGSENSKGIFVPKRGSSVSAKLLLGIKMVVALRRAHDTLERTFKKE